MDFKRSQYSVPLTRDADSVYEACRRRDYVARFLFSFHEYRQKCDAPRIGFHTPSAGLTSELTPRRHVQWRVTVRVRRNSVPSPIILSYWAPPPSAVGFPLPTEYRVLQTGCNFLNISAWFVFSAKEFMFFLPSSVFLSVSKMCISQKVVDQFG